MTNKEKNEVIVSLHNEGLNPKEISERLQSEHDISLSRSAVEGRLRRMGVDPHPVPRDTDKHLPDNINSGGTVDPGSEDEFHEPKHPKTGVVDKHGDGTVIINYSTRQYWTYLGEEYQPYLCSFGRFQAIQRAYSDMYEGKGENQADMAMRFDFPHTRAFARFVKAHGLRHSSMPQTDVEFEEGLTEEEAVEETIQSLKRSAYKKTQKRIWRETQADADKWRNFDESVLEPLRADIKANLPSYEVPKLDLPENKGTPYVLVNGLTDWHFTKYAFGVDGRPTYNMAIASAALRHTMEDLLAKAVRYGKPERCIVVVGSDNFHIDTPMKTTTRGTPQDVDGEYETGIKPYIDEMIWNIEAHRQVAPVTVVVAPGNHDYVTSLWLGHLLQYRYEDTEDVEVILRSHPRVYIQVGAYCLGFTHGEEFASNAKMERNIHKVFLSEARDQGVKIGKVEHFYMFAGHLHHEFSKDFGVVTFNIMPSLCGDDRWHKKEVFVGARQQTKGYLIDEVDGLVGNIYSIYETTKIR